MPSPGFFLLLIAVILGASFTSAAASTQASCPLDPVTLPLFDATPASDIPDALATPASPDDPGTAAGDAETALFSSAVETLLACVNSGDAGLAYAIFSERYLASMFADGVTLYQPALEQSIAEATSDERADPLILEGVSEVLVRDNGRLSGRTVVSSAGQSWTDILVLDDSEGQWLIDDVIPVSR